MNWRKWRRQPGAAATYLAVTQGEDRGLSIPAAPGVVIGRERGGLSDPNWPRLCGYLARDNDSRALKFVCAKSGQETALVGGVRLNFGQVALRAKTFAPALPAPDSGGKNRAWMRWLPFFGLAFSGLIMLRFFLPQTASFALLPAIMLAIVLIGLVVKVALARCVPIDFAGLHYRLVAGPQREKLGDSYPLRIGPGRVFNFVPGRNYLFCGRGADQQILASIALLGLRTNVQLAGAGQVEAGTLCLHLDGGAARHGPDCSFLLTGEAVTHTCLGELAQAERVRRLWWPWAEKVGTNWLKQLQNLLATNSLADSVVVDEESVRALAKQSHSASPQLFIGIDRDGPLIADLAVDPHLLIAGTTGCGKSICLETLIRSACARYTATELNFLLVDYKGGDAFAKYRDLPHVLGVLTDQNPGATVRALEAIDYEIACREAGSSRIPLLVVVDEFAELARIHPDIRQRLERIATLGRGLGIHLIIATQRPQGVVSEQMLANISGRIILRVLSAAESMLLLQTDQAAALPHHPGRAIALLAGRTTTVQVARFEQQHCASPPSSPAQPPWLEPLPSPCPSNYLDLPAWAILDLPQRRKQLPAPLPPTLAVIGGPASGVTGALQAAAALKPSHSAPLVISGGPWPGALKPDSRCVLAALEEAGSGETVIIDDLSTMLTCLDQRGGPGFGLSTLIQLRSRLGEDGHLLLGSHQVGQTQQLTQNFCVLEGIDLADWMRLELAPAQRSWLKARGAALFSGPALQLDANDPEVVMGQVCLPPVELPHSWAQDVDLAARNGLGALLLGARGERFCFPAPFPIVLVATTQNAAKQFANHFLAGQGVSEICGDKPLDAGQLYFLPALQSIGMEQLPALLARKNIAIIFLTGQLPTVSLPLNNHLDRSHPSQLVLWFNGKLHPCAIAPCDQNRS